MAKRKIGKAYRKVALIKEKRIAREKFKKMKKKLLCQIQVLKSQLHTYAALALARITCLGVQKK